MNTEMERLFLETVLRQGSLVPLIRCGHAYSLVIRLYEELMAANYIIRDENGVDQLTESGKKRLIILRKTRKAAYKMIQPLRHEKVAKMKPEDIYLP